MANPLNIDEGDDETCRFTHAHAQGPDALYVQHGEALAEDVRAAGGVLTAQDLRNAAPVVRDAISIQVRGRLAHRPRTYPQWIMWDRLVWVG